MVIRHIHSVQRGIPYHHEPCLACCSAFGHCDQIPGIINLDRDKVCFNSVTEEGSNPWPGGFIAFEPVEKQDIVAGAGGDSKCSLLGSKEKKEEPGSALPFKAHSPSLHFLPVGPYRSHHHL